MDIYVLITINRAHRGKPEPERPEEFPKIKGGESISHHFA
jgi:hypothetical protein